MPRSLDFAARSPNARAEVEFSVIDIHLAVCHLHSAMTGNELLRKLKRFARKTKMVFEFDPSAGKGGHGEIRFGDRYTMLRSARQKEIPRGTLRAMLSQLGIDPRDI